MSSEGQTPKTSPSTSGSTAQPSAAAATQGGASVSSLEVAKPAEEYIRLRVITSDMTNEVHFRVKAATAMGRLKQSYCSKLGLSKGELRFVFDGHRITDEDTPEELGLINDDVIEVYQERTGGYNMSYKHL